MARWSVASLAAAAAAAAAVTLLAAGAAADGGTSCGPNNLCPQNLPCCSQYGQCGIGAYCLGGCDPLFSHSLDSCMAAPVCSSQDYKLTDLSDMQSNTQYLGDASKAAWVYSGEPKNYTDGGGSQVLLTMPQQSVGTLLASTAYVWYGKVSATLKTSRDKGVVTAFILLSDVKDEIDFEFVGTDLQTAQTNFYFQGITNYNNGNKSTVSSDTFENYHTYEIDWKPDTITWSIDGNQVRTVNKKDTFNKTANRYEYPQTPARVQLSLWPAGLSSNGQGTVEWAGGLIDWNSPDVQNAHYYYAMVKEVQVQCYDPPSDAKQQGNKAYAYTDSAGLEANVAITNNNTVLKSFQGSGLDPNAGAPASASASGAAASATSNAPTVPGLSGAGSGADGQRGGSGSAPSGVSGSGGSGSGGGSQTGSAGAPAGTGFQQGNTPSAASALKAEETVLRGSLLAVLLAIAGMLVL